MKVGDKITVINDDNKVKGTATVVKILERISKPRERFAGFVHLLLEDGRIKTSVIY